MAPRIPVELINKIVKNANYTELKSHSLVSVEWAGLCQRYLFRRFKVDPGESYPIYDQGQHLWQYIRSLTIDSFELDESKAGDTPERKSGGRDHESFPVFLHGLNRVESLYIHDLRWSVLSTAALKGLIKVLSNPRFKRLDISPNASWEGFPLALLCHCPSLKTLAFHHNDALSTEIVPSLELLPGLPTKVSWVSPLRVTDLMLEGGQTIDMFMFLSKDGGEGVDEETKNREEGDGEELVEDQEWRGLVQLDQISRLCLGFLDEDLRQGDEVSDLLKICGPSLVDLTLLFERHIDETELGFGIQRTAVAGLDKLRRLSMFYCCPGAGSFTLDGAEEWFFPFMQDLPSPDQLIELDICWVINHSSSLDHVERHMLRQFDNFLKTLKLISERFTHLQHFKFESRTPWDCPEDIGDVYYPRQELPEYEDLVRGFCSPLELKGVQVQVILA